MTTERSTFRGRALALAGVSALAIGLAFGVPGRDIPAYAETAAPGASVALHSYADIVAAAKPAVVTVTTEIAARPAQFGKGEGGMPPDEFFRRFFGEGGPFQGMPGMPDFGPGPRDGGPQGPGGMALGSGFIVSADGYVVTNNHVVDNASKITVTLDDGTELAASLVGRDVKHDIAVLKVGADKPLPTVAWGDSDTLRLGDPVIAIGDPFGIGTTVTSGIVSARGRDLHNGPYDDFIQVDAAINHGNSGGPLLDATGKVVGVNTAIYSPNGGNVGVGFAIPSNQASEVVAAIIKGGSIEHGYIGVSIQGLDADIAGAVGLDKARGALVAAVETGSPAAGAGVRQGDIILSVNGTEAQTPRDVSRMIADLRPGEKATLGLWRDGKEEKLTFAVGQMDAERTALADTPATPGNGDVAVGDLGIEVATLDPETRAQLGLAEGETGVVVTGVDQAGPAADKGIEAGDVILSVNQSAVASPDDMARLLGDAKAQDRKAALLLVERQGNRMFVAVPLKDA
ncbi:MAG: DegQ family serine endoprotease [Rhodobacteraceae bacterium]|nr:DegQ family serine endoprotease [Paracoccaceae bacterium]